MTSTSKSNWVPIDGSSTIHSTAYSKSENKLYIRYKTGQIYSYDDVPVSVYNEMLQADSIGRFVRDNIAYEYKYKRVV